MKKEPAKQTMLSQKWRSEGRCTSCGIIADKKPNGSRYSLCVVHREEARKRQLNRREPTRQSQKWRADGLCIRCGEKPDKRPDGKVFSLCTTHREKARKNAINMNLARKIQTNEPSPSMVLELESSRQAYANAIGLANRMKWRSRVTMLEAQL